MGDPLRLFVGTGEKDEGCDHGGIRPATSSDVVAWLRAKGVGHEVKVTDSGKRDWIDPVIRLTPNKLVYGDPYLVIALERDTTNE